MSMLSDIAVLLAVAGTSLGVTVGAWYLAAARNTAVEEPGLAIAWRCSRVSLKLEGYVALPMVVVASVGSDAPLVMLAVVIALIATFQALLITALAVIPRGDQQWSEDELVDAFLRLAGQGVVAAPSEVHTTR